MLQSNQLPNTLFSMGNESADADDRTVDVFCKLVSMASRISLLQVRDSL